MKCNIILMAALLLFLNCEREEKVPGTKLEPGTPVYDSARQLAKQYPFLDPDKNLIILDCRSFTVTTGDVIKELYLFFEPLLELMSSQENTTKARAQIFHEAERIAKRRLAAHAAIAENISIPEAEIDSVVARFRTVKMLHNDLPAFLQEKGLTTSFLRQILREEQLAKRYYKVKMQGRIEASEAEIRESYDASVYLNVRLMFLSIENLTDENKQKKKNLMRRIKNMLDEDFSFTELAKTYSEDSSSAQYGGKIEGVRRGKFPDEVNAVIFEMKEGQVSDIIETASGLYIFMVEKHVADTRPFDKVYAIYKSQVEYQKRAKVQSELVEALRKQSNCRLHEKW